MMKKIKCILFSFFVMMSLMLIQMQVFATPEISKSKVTISVGSSTHLKLSVVTSKISWKSSKPSVATVSSTGKVTGKGIGTAKITATYKGKKYNCMVTVKSKFEKGTWFMSPQGGFVLKIHKVQGNKFIFSSWVNKVRCNKVTATIKKNGKNATAKFKCKNGKMHYLDFTWIKNGVRIKENSSCYNKLLSPLGQSGNKVTASFYTESYWYAHMY